MSRPPGWMRPAPGADAAQQPAGLVPLGVDGFDLPGDWNLQLANQAGKALRREIPLSPQLPITP